MGGLGHGHGHQHENITIDWDSIKWDELTPEEKWNYEHLRMHQKHAGHAEMHAEMILILLVVLVVSQVRYKVNIEVDSIETKINSCISDCLSSMEEAKTFILPFLHTGERKTILTTNCFTNANCDCRLVCG